jgi:hypothetical protein
VALVGRLGMPDGEAFSGWMLTFTGGFALAKRYCRPTVCPNRLQLIKEQPSSLQVWRIKSFCEPGIQVA